MRMPKLLMHRSAKSPSSRIAALLVLLLLGGAPAVVAAPPPGRVPALLSDIPSGQEIGTPITLSVAPEYVEEGARYRLGVASIRGPGHVMYDFAAATEFEWTPFDAGLYLLILSVRSTDTDEVSKHRRLFWIRSPEQRVSVKATSHPLVALYSARVNVRADRRARRRCGPLATRCQMRVVFQEDGSDQVNATSPRPIRGWGATSFLVAGMRSESLHRMRHEILDWRGQHVSHGPVVEFETGIGDPAKLDGSVIVPPGSAASREEPVLFTAGFARPRFQPAATNLDGETIWYSDRPAPLLGTRIVGGGTWLAIETGPDGANSVVSELDLTSNVVRSTNLERVNEQLVLMGQDEIVGFHHEARRLPSGHTVLLGAILRTLVDVQGPGEVHVLGDNIIALDEDFQVSWVWNAFDHLDPTRRAILNTTCAVGCPPLPVAPGLVNDWLHANALEYSSNDGNLILSIRHQDWIVKVDYRDGAGDGQVIWRLGPEGDFDLESDAPLPWFGYAHDPNWLPENRLVLFDNGNSRCALLGDCMSRGQVYEIDEDRMIARLQVSLEVGRFVPALGSAQQLRNGSYSFGLGFVPLPSDPTTWWSHAVELLPDGATARTQAIHGPSYRMYRLRDLYTPPVSERQEPWLAPPEGVPSEADRVRPGLHGAGAPGRVHPRFRRQRASR